MKSRSSFPSNPRIAFTLIELLVVIGLIALVAGLAAPALKTKSISLDAAHRQLADDLNRARQLAIATRSTVYMVFMPVIDTSIMMTNVSTSQKSMLATRQARGYAVFSRSSIGAQPGRDDLRYLSEWKELPEGVFISTNKFSSSDSGFFGFLPMDFLDNVPIPTLTGTYYKRLPYIAYDYTGALTLSEGGDVRRPQRDGENWRRNVAARAVIPLVAGSLSVPRVFDATLRDSILDWKPVNILVKPPYDPNGNFFALTNYIKRVVVDPLTGRAHVEGGEIQ